MPTVPCFLITTVAGFLIVFLGVLAAEETHFEIHKPQDQPSTAASEAVIKGSVSEATTPSSAASNAAKLWVVNNCAGGAVYQGGASKPLDSKYTQNGGSSDGIGRTNMVLWVDGAEGKAGCFANQCNDAGRTLAELEWNKNGDNQDAIDISLVKGFNVPVKIEVLGNINADDAAHPSKVVCNSNTCADAFIPCDTAARNTIGAAPNWMYPSNTGLTYKVTFCAQDANTQSNQQLAARKELEKKMKRLQPLPAGKQMVWCQCEWNKTPTAKIWNHDEYSVFSGANCGPVG